MLPRNKRLSRPVPGSGSHEPLGGKHNPKQPPKKHPHKPNGPKGDGKPGKGKGHGKKKGSAFFGGRGGYKGVRKQRVKRLVNGVIRDEVRDLDRERKSVRREYKRDAVDVNRQYKRGRQDLKHVFGETGDYLGYLGNQASDQAQQQSNQIALAQKALEQQLGNTYTGAADQVTGELDRLGISGGGSLGQLQADYANNQALGAQAGANAQSTLGLMGGNTQQMMGLLQGMNQGSYMSNAGLNLQRRNDALIEARGNRDENMQAIRDAIRDVRGGRRDLFFQMLNQLQETGWGQYMDQQQLKMARRELNHRLKKDK
jgi:hypothetical protein